MKKLWLCVLVCGCTEAIQDEFSGNSVVGPAVRVRIVNTFTRRPIPDLESFEVKDNIKYQKVELKIEINGFTCGNYCNSSSCHCADITFGSNSKWSGLDITETQVFGTEIIEMNEMDQGVYKVLNRYSADCGLTIRQINGCMRFSPTTAKNVIQLLNKDNQIIEEKTLYLKFEKASDFDKTVMLISNDSEGFHFFEQGYETLE